MMALLPMKSSSYYRSFRNYCCLINCYYYLIYLLIVDALDVVFAAAVVGRLDY